MPNVSVLMSVFNEQRFVGQAIESVLRQTYDDFEFIIINDGSTDRSEEVIGTFDDRRIRYLRNEQRQGLARALNRGIAEARGELVARLDADDAALPHRLNVQAAFLQHHPGYAMVGAQAIVLSEEGNQLCICPVPASEDEIREQMPTRCCFLHSTVMFRRDAVMEVGNYRPLFQFAQDYDLWLRLGERYPLANLAEPLIYRRLKTLSPSVARLHVQERYAEWARRFAAQRKERGGDDLMDGNTDAFERDIATLESLRGVALRRQLAENYFSWAKFCLWQGATGAYRRYLRMSLRTWPFQEKTWSHIFEAGRGRVSQSARRLLAIR